MWLTNIGGGALGVVLRCIMMMTKHILIEMGQTCSWKKVKVRAFIGG